MTDGDPTITNPHHYRTMWENEHVRVLEYSDMPGESTTPHDHPNSVMITLSAFRRLLSSDGATREVELPAGRASGWQLSRMPERTSATLLPTRS
jgi:hypothetical protein